MFANCYNGVLDDWKLKVINRRARKMGLRGFDLDDAQQQVVLALRDFQFDEARSNGASEVTAFTSAVNRQLSTIRRSESRASKWFDVERDGHEDSYEESGLATSLDVDCVVESLTELDRRICHELSHGVSINELARSLGMSWHAVRDRIASIRQYFERHGLSGSHLSNADTTVS